MGTTKATAERVDSVRENAGLTRRDLSDASGIPYETLRRRLLGHVPFNVEEIEVCARVLGVSGDQLAVFPAVD